MENLVLQKDHIVTSAETDILGNLRAGALLNICIQAAIDSADLLGFGFVNLHPQKLFWVLSRFSIELERPVKWQEKITIQTWPKGMDRFFYLRDFLLFDKENKPLGRATSSWLAVHTETRRPSKIETGDTTVIFGMAGKHALDYLPKDIPSFDGEKVDQRSPRNFDYDLNGHVTSTRYIDWMMDTLSLEIYRNTAYRAFHINFLKETMPGDTLQIFSKEHDNNVIFWEGIHERLTRPAFRGIIHLF